MRAWAATFAALLLASPAAAAPKGAKAKVEFDRGVAAYQKQDYAAASDALAASFKLEADVETLFAWAQSERLLERCEKAIELFGKLLDFNLPAENKKVVQEKIDECKAIMAAKQPAPAPPPEPVKPPEPVPVKPPESRPSPASGSGSPWWKDPIGDGLVVLGAVGLGAGGYFLMSARQAEQDSMKSDSVFKDKNDLAEKNGKLGVIAATVGGVLLVGGVVRYMTRGGGGNKERTALTGWVSPDGGGFAAVGRF